MTSQDDDITRTADRLRDALGAAAELMTASPSADPGRRAKIGRHRGWLLPSSAAASIVAIALVAVFIGQFAGDTSGPTIAAGGIGPVHSANVSAPPDPAVLKSPGVQAARSRVVKIIGYAPACGRVVEGSGFVYAPQHVITNAKVVAGVTSPGPTANGLGPIVTTVGGKRLASRVVFYDPQIDIAVLDVPGLKVAPLRFNAHAKPGDNAVVAGYPETHAFTAVPARIAKVERAEGPDIYQDSQVERQIYQIRGLVREGNVGGPLLSPSGTVDGVVFAAEVGKPYGFVLTAAEIKADAEAGATATTPVSTQDCAP